MRKLGSLWRTLTVCVGCALAVAAVGCGDDEGDGEEPVAGSGGSGGSGGKGGSGGSGGKGGAGGKGGSGGSTAPTKEQCITQTNTIFTGQPSGPSAACISCICTENATAVGKCNANAQQCWGLIECVTAMCLTETDLAGCVTDKCGEFAAGGSATALPLQGTLQQTCEAQCVPNAEDAGAPDAG